MATQRQKQQRERRLADARKSLDSHGSSFTSTSYKLPEGSERYQFKKPGLYRIDIIPFEVKIPVRMGGVTVADTEELYWTRPLIVHRKIGPDNSDYCCLRKQFGQKRCPICDHLNQLLLEPLDKETRTEYLKAFGEKERQLYKFYDRTSRESREKGVQIYETSFYMGFGELLDAKLKKARLKDEEHPHLYFASPKQGFTLEVQVEEDTYQGKTFYKPVDIDFLERKDSIDDDMIDSICLDDLPLELSYDDLKKILHQTGAGGGQESKKEPGGTTRSTTTTRTRSGTDEEESEKGYRASPKRMEDKEDEGDLTTAAPRRGRGKADKNGEYTTASEKDISKGSQVDSEEWGACEVTHISADGTSLTLKDGDGELHRAVSVDDVELVEEEEEPKSKSRMQERSKPTTKSKAPPPDEDDEAEEDEEDSDLEEDEDEDDEVSEDEDEDEPEEEEEPKRPVKGKGKRK